MPALQPAQLLQAAAGETTAQIRERVVRAHALALERQGMANQALQWRAMDRHLQLAANASNFAQSAATRLGWSGRSLHRALKVARTIADLAGSAHIETAHVAEAVQYRRALLGPQ